MKTIVLIFFLSTFSKTLITAQHWSAVGSGIGDLSYGGPVSSLIIHNGELYAAGYFITAGGNQANNIAKWNGTNWSALGTGIAGGYNGEGVHSQIIYNGSLYVGGFFTSAGGRAARNIAKWDGTDWSAVGAGIGMPPGGWVSALAVYNGELYAAGSFSYAGGVQANNIARWDGTIWQPAEIGIMGEVYSLTVHNGELYAGGWFSEAGGIPTNNIAKWNGINWSSPGTGIGNPNSNNKILSLVSYNGFLYAAGLFDSLGAVAANNIAKWDGSNWSTLGTGIGNYYNGDHVISLTVYDGEVHAGGIFTGAGGIAANYIAKWTGTTWASLGAGTNYGVGAMTADSLCLYAGGGFDSAGGYYAFGIAKWTEFCSGPPASPVHINGNDTACSGSDQVYFIDPVSEATHYTWSLPNGWSGTSVTDSIQIIAGSNSGPISVTANNMCGSSAVQSLPVIVNSIPTIPALILGNDTVCEGSSQTYSIVPVPGAIGYAWDLSFGWAGGMYDSSITITVAQSSQIDHIISVSAFNECGNSDLQVLPVIVKPLAWADDINGNVKVCRGSIQTYSTYAYPNTNFTWILPPGWIVNSTSNNSITVTVGDTAGIILVRAHNDCGISAYKSLSILIDSILLKPTEIIGNMYVYFDKTADYSIDPMPGANGYEWSVSGGGTIISGQNSSNISVKWQTPGKYILSVHANNSCGSGSNKSITILVADRAREDSFDVRMFPNPSKGQFYVSAKRVQGKLISVEVLNVAGQVIYRSEKIQGSNRYSQLIDSKKSLQGVYVVKILVDDAIYTRKIVLIE